MSTITVEAGKQKYVDLSVEVLDPEDETCTSSDVESTVEVLEVPIDDVEMEDCQDKVPNEDNAAINSSYYQHSVQTSHQSASAATGCTRVLGILK